MKDIFIVQQSDADKARQMEKTLLSLPAESGILFVGVEILKAPTNLPGPTFRVFVGCDWNMDPSVVGVLSHRLIGEMVKHPDQLVVVIRRGVVKQTITS